MAIKIIKEGIKKEKVVKFECRGCGCIFEASGQDISERIDEDNIYYSRYWISDCPCCKNRCIAKYEYTGSIIGHS